MKTRFRGVLASCFPLALMATANGQAFNVDIQATGDPLPAFTYGAGAGQQGFWTEFDPQSGFAVLNDAATGGMSNVTLTHPDFLSTDMQSGIPAPHDDLFQDYARIAQANATWTFDGLAPGDYNVVTHAWVEGGTTALNVTINGMTQTISGSGFWSGLSSPDNFVSMQTTVGANGQLTIDTGPAISAAMRISGIQLVPINPVISTEFCSNPMGQVAVMDVVGSESLTINNVTLVATGCPANSFGFFIYGPTQGFNPAYCGINCINTSGGIGRLSVAPISPLGEASFPLDVNTPPAGAPAFVVGTMNFQYFFREFCNGGISANFSNGVAVNFIL